MAYQVFALKYRPQNFDDLVGQEHIVVPLKNAITSGKLHHAFLFAGTRGVGKTSAARILAKALNCTQGPTINPCDKCDSCRQIISGGSLDVLEIDAASQTGVDDVRVLRENLSYGAMYGKYRIIILDEAHMLSKNAWNALLKVVEEPPEHVIFIFATTEPSKVMDTILSRVQRYDFKRIIQQDIKERFKVILKKEAIEFEDTALTILAQKAEGSMRDGLTLLDQAVAFSGDNKISEASVKKLLGLVESEHYREIFLLIVNHESSRVVDSLAKICTKGYDLEEFVYGFYDYLRGLLICS
ncbi:MAG: DNA polymerase III subunit gamma/tau, partial [Elusimicrobiota bacterium]